MARWKKPRKGSLEHPTKKDYRTCSRRDIKKGTLNAILKQADRKNGGDIREIMEMLRLDLIIERGSDDMLTGRVTYNDNLIVDQAANVKELKELLKQLLHDFEDVHPEVVEFVHRYDVYALFDDFDFLKITSIVVHAGINPRLLRQYASGMKHPSAAQAKRIEETIHRLAYGMRRAYMYAE